MKPTKFFALGGLQEIGKTCLVVEYDQEIAIIDAGIKFTNSMETGVDGIIPDYSYLKANQDKITGVFITHGHEDHIGGIPHLVNQVDIKTIYAPQFAIEIIKTKFKEKKINKKIEFVPIERDSLFEFKDIKVDVWTSQHSIPDSFGIRVRTPNGSVVDTGDFRFDYTPIGNLTDFTKLKEWAKDGVDIFISDSTNAMSLDHSPTEKNILIDIENFIKNAPGKVLFTTFASNMNRVKAVIDLAVKHKRKVCAFGRSMVKLIDIARKMKFIDVPDSVLLIKKQISSMGHKEVLVLSTGSQGEELAALSKIATNKQNWVTLKRGDLIIFSSSAIPGNAMRIEQLINNLYKLNADVKENNVDGVLHTSGHAYKDEHNKIFRIVKPKHFVPYHGAYRQTATHGQTAIENGVKPEKVFLLKNGDVLEMTNHIVKKADYVIDPGPIYIDSGIASRQTTHVIQEREKLGKNGFINIVATIDKNKNEIVGRTKILSRGTVHIRDNFELMQQIQKMAHGAILYTIKNNPQWKKADIKEVVEKRVGPLFYKIKRRRPSIFTSILILDKQKQITNLKKEKAPVKHQQHKGQQVQKN